MAALTQSLTFTGQRVVSRAQQAPKRASVVTKAALKHADELLETAVRETLVSGEFTEPPAIAIFFPAPQTRAVADPSPALSTRRPR